MSKTVTPEIGKFYTMSACKRASGDRSWIGYVWEVMASNFAAVTIQAINPRHSCWKGSPSVVDVSEFDFTEATPRMVELARLEEAKK